MKVDNGKNNLEFTIRLKCYHHKLVVLVGGSWKSKRGQDTCTKREVGVENGSMLRGTSSSYSPIETGPKHPQENGSNHWEHVRCTSRSLKKIVNEKLSGDFNVQLMFYVQHVLTWLTLSIKFGLYITLEAVRPKYAPKRWTKIVSPASTAYKSKCMADECVWQRLRISDAAEWRYFTPRYFLPMTSLIVNRTISIRAMTISCSGEVFPITTPKEMRTAADAKSL